MLKTEKETSKSGVMQILVPTGIVLAAVVGFVLLAYGLDLVGLPEPPATVVRVQASPSVSSAVPGEVVTYVVTVSNEASREEVEILSVSDTLLGDLSDAFPSRLAARASEQATVDRRVQPNDPDPLRNTVTVSAAAGEDPVEATASAEVDLLEPAVRVQATLMPQTAAPGEEVVYSVSLSNVGEVVLEPLTVTDSLEGDVSGAFASTLAPGASQGQAFDWPIPTEASGSIRRTVTVYAGTAGAVVSDTAAVSLDLTKPAVRIESAVSPAATVPGETVTYTISLANAGQVDLQSVTVSDSLQADLTSSFPSTLTVGTSREQSFAWTIGRADALPFTRTVTVRAEGLGEVVSDTATAVVDLLRPDLRVDATVLPTTALRGGAATYTLTVVNAGKVDLRAIRVEDSFLGDVSRAFPNALPAGTSRSQSYTWSSQPDAAGPLIRSVTVSGEGVGQTVSDTTTAALNLAGVAVSTTGPAGVQAGERVSVTVTVTNTSSAGAPDLVLERVVNSGRELAVPDGCRILAQGGTCSFNYAVVVPAQGETFTTDVEVGYRPDGLTDVFSASAEHSMAIASGWERGTGTPDGAEVRALVACAADHDVVYAGFGIQGGGVYRSGDGGRSWVGSGLQNEDAEVFGLAVDPDDCDTVYAGAWRDGVRKSVDGGRTWDASLAGLEGAFVYSVAVDPTDRDVVYAGTAEQGVYRSDDGGDTWRAWGLDGLTVPHLSVGSNGRVVYAATWGDGVRRRERSGVGWEAWEAVNGGIADEHRDVYAVAVDPRDASMVFAATASGGLYRTLNGGGTWERALPAPGTAYAVAVEPRLDRTVYAGTPDGVYQSEARGESGSWEPFNAGLEGLAVRSLALGPEGAVHLGTSNGAWRRLP